MTTDPKPPAPRCGVCTTNHGNAPCGGDCPCNDGHMPDLQRRYGDLLEAWTTNNNELAALQRENAGLRQDLVLERAALEDAVCKGDSHLEEVIRLREKLEAAEGRLAGRREIRLVGPGIDPVVGYLTDLFELKEAAEGASMAKIERMEWLARETGEYREQLATAIQERNDWNGAQLATRQALEASVAAENAARAELEQERVQHAGCLVAAEGGTAPEQVADRGDYGWSLAYQKTLDLRHAYDTVRAEAATVAAQLAELEHKYARLVSLSSDDARRLVSARDAAEAQLAEVRAESERYRGLANEAGDSVLAERDAAEAREAELRGLLERADRIIFRWYEAPPWKAGESSVGGMTREWREDFAAWLAAHPVALPKETTE